MDGLPGLLGEHQYALPDDVYEQKEKTRQIQESMLGLTSREEQVLRRRFGLGDYEPQTLRAIGQEMGFVHQPYPEEK